MLSEILTDTNLILACAQVTGNAGAPGIDGMRTDQLEVYLGANIVVLKESLLTGTYRPQPVRKVEIPKPQGGTRMLGIPTVIDRFIQQAIAQWLGPIYDKGFSEYSYGFRPQRSAHQAVRQAQKNVNEGYEWVVELDLEKFFDRVNHDRLMGRLAKSVTDKGTLKLIRSYLTSGIMEGGVVSQRTEGTPQGSPLSPLLSNIVLDELDKELEARNHRFVRYADDCSIYVRSEKAAHRVMETVTQYIESKLKLKVNREKSKVSRPDESTLLGFTFRRKEERWEITIAPKSMKRIKEKMREKTQRKSPVSTKDKIKKMQSLIAGWVSYFALANAQWWMKDLDGFVRTRLRSDIWKQWKQPKTRASNLKKLGAQPGMAIAWSYSRKGCYRVAQSQILKFTLKNEYFADLGYLGFEYHYLKKLGPNKLF
jgi:RNA-directed DNA polymerase